MLLFLSSQKNSVAIAAFARSFTDHGKASAGQAFEKALIMVFAPDGEGAAWSECRTCSFNGPAAVNRIILLIGLGMGAAIEVEDNGIKSPAGFFSIAV